VQPFTQLVWYGPVLVAAGVLAPRSRRLPATIDPIGIATRR